MESIVSQIKPSQINQRRALTSTTDHRMLQDWRLCGHVGARSPSGLHGVWGAFITDGSHHDLVIITGAPQQDPATMAGPKRMLLISDSCRWHSKAREETQQHVEQSHNGSGGNEMSRAMTKPAPFRCCNL
ncbi:hypothetical protein V8C42DRAFT_317071 [Trichoderma barbatum]